MYGRATKLLVILVAITALSPPTLAPPSRPESCASLADMGWEPPSSLDGLNLIWDPESGAATIELPGREPMQLTDIADPDCRRLPRLGAVLARSIGNEERIRAEECTSAVAQIRSGQPPRHGAIIGSLPALVEHVKSYCPQQYSDELKGLRP